MKRYKIRCHDCDPEIVQHDAGKWVRYTDVESLRAELELHKGALIAEQEHVETLEAELAECRGAAVYLFNCGYMRGHHDTVEACFVDIHDSDMRTYQSDVVAEVIDEALTARKGEGE
jgi:hypothetical protein